MKKLLSVLLVISLLAGCFSLSMPVYAAKKEANAKTIVLIEAASDGTLGGAAQSDVVSAQRDMLTQVENISDPDVLYSYTSVLNGVAAEVRKGDIDLLRALDGVADVVELSGVKPVVESVRAAGEISSAPMIGLDTAREMGYDGTGTAIAIIDGGFQVDHAAMHLTDETTAKFSKEDIAAVIRSHTMNSEKITADAVYKNAKVPFAFDYCGDDAEVLDSENSFPEHGTHVSGIAAGNSDKLTGIAPEAQVLMFKIDVYEEEVFLANLLAAIDDASKFDIAGMNMSVAMDYEIASAPAYALLAEAIANARKAGILVCTAAGNAGSSSSKIYMPDNGANGIPNSFDGATSVASVDNIYLSDKVGNVPEYVVYDGDKTAEVIGYGYTPFPNSVELVPMGKYRPTEDLSGKCALLYLSQSSYTRALRAVLDSKAAALIISQTAVDEIFWGLSDEDYDLLTAIADVKAMLIVSELDAYRLYHAKNKTVSVRYSEGHYVEPAETLQMSYFSSWGIRDDGGMTVDIAAPGGVIYSSVIGGQYDVYDGTSMASPHITGVSALLEQHLNGKSVAGLSKADLKEALLMSTAEPVRTNGVPASPRVEGAGLVDLSRALTANAVLLGKEKTSALNLGDGLDSTFTFTFTVQNISDETVRYDTLSLDVCADEYKTYRSFDEKTGKYSDEYYLTGESAPLDFTIRSDMPRSISLQPGEAHKVTVTVSVDEEQFAAYQNIFTNGFFMDGYVTLSDVYGDKKATTLNMPFLGFAGDWDAVPALEYDDWWEEYYVIRGLREIEFIFSDADGNVVGTSKEEYVTKGRLLQASPENIPDGVYTVTVKATPVAAETAQIYTIENFLVDTKSPEIVRVKKQRNLDGSGTITVTMRDADTAYFGIHGGSVLNASFLDMYPADEYDHVDKDGNFVYVLEYDKLPLGWFVVEAVDASGMIDSHGVYSPLMALVNLFESVSEYGQLLWYLLQIVFGTD